MKTVLVTGASGLIGKQLCAKLMEKGYTVRALTRNISERTPYRQYLWHLPQGFIDEKVFRDLDYIVHLAGANISDGRWTDQRREDILTSREDSAALLHGAMKITKSTVKAFISSSAVGYYGAQTSDQIYREEDSPLDDFIGTVCQKWEAAADKFQQEGIRTVKLRTGVVLSERGGALPKLTTPVKFGVGSGLGSGKQYMPWIHIDDIVNMYIKAIEDENMQGAYNAVAPEHITNRNLVKQIGKVLRRLVILPNAPSFVLKWIFGEMSVIVLEGSRISSDKIVQTGFQYQFPSIQNALKNLLLKR